jgi:hypothetical protein
MLSFAACGVGGGFDENEDESDITDIHIFANDWNQFNNGRNGRSPIYQALKKKLGIDLYADSVGMETYDTNLELKRTSGTLPEMFLIDGPVKPNQYNGLIREDEVIAVDDYVNERTKNKYPYLYEYMKEFEYMKHNVENAKDKIWFIPTKWSNEKSLYVRQDWINNLNAKLAKILVADGVIAQESDMTAGIENAYRFKVPDTLTEFYRLARAFTVHDPKNDGSTTYGYMTEKNRDMDSWMHIACGTGWKQWETDSTGKYVNTNTTEGAKVATSIFNKMMAEGYISQEIFTADVNTKQQKFANGSAGMMYAHNWYNVILAEMMSADGITKEQARERVAIADTPKGPGGAFGGHGDANYYRGFCINADMSQARIGKCLELMEFLRTPEGIELVTHGVEGEHWEVNEEEEKISLIGEDGNGFIQALRWTDNAGFIIYLTYEPHESNNLMTNGDILSARATASAQSQHSSDYPAVYTNSSIKYQTSANNHFDTTTLNMIKNAGLKAAWTFDAKTWSADGWTKLFSVSSAFQAAWDSFVSDYNGSYHGSIMDSEYNRFIESGKAQKRAGLT